MSGEETAEEQPAEEQPADVDVADVAEYKLVRGRFIDEDGNEYEPGDTLILSIDYATGRDRFERVED